MRHRTLPVPREPKGSFARGTEKGGLEPDNKLHKRGNSKTPDELWLRLYRVIQPSQPVKRKGHWGGRGAYLKTDSRGGEI